MRDGVVQKTRSSIGVHLWERFENSPGRGGQRLEDVADADEGDGDVADRHDEPAGDEPEGKE